MTESLVIVTGTGIPMGMNSPVGDGDGKNSRLDSLGGDGDGEKLSLWGWDGVSIPDGEFPVAIFSHRGWQRSSVDRWCCRDFTCTKGKRD